MNSQKQAMETQAATQEAALVIIGTPIGNLGDISIRAIKELTQVDLICCEDTRRTGNLLKLLNVSPRPKLSVLNEHTEKDKSNEIIRLIQSGSRIALVTDAGMPAIADPGQYLIRTAIENRIKLEIIPGPTAGIAALIASGLSTTRFVFQGFLPRKGNEREERLVEITTEEKTTIIYESGKRLAKTIKDLTNICGEEREVAIARELTKLHEEIHRGTLALLQERIQELSTKGEFVIVISGFKERLDLDDNFLKNELTGIISDGKSKRDAVSELAIKYPISKKRLYDLSIEIADQD